MPEERLQKIIARAGLCSRRHAEELIQEGRVRVNGARAKLGDKADPGRDHVKVDGKLLKPAPQERYVLLFKPREVVTTCDDPEERTTVIDLVKPVFPERLFPVGRLDYHSEGLLLLTNDGELAARVTHPRYGVVRVYMVKIKGDLSDSAVERLLRGTTIEGHRVVPLAVRREWGTKSGANSWWRIEITEGRTHEVRELFFRVGHRVVRLRRVAIGPISDESMQPGEFRELTQPEVKALGRIGRGAAKGKPGSQKPPARPRQRPRRKTEAKQPKRRRK